METSATPPYANPIRDVRNRRPDNEVLHIQLHASDLAMLPFHTRLLWLIPLPEEWSWLPTWRPGVHPDAYKNADIWKKQQYVGAQSLSSTEPAASLAATPLTSGQSLSSGRPAPSTAPVLSPVAEEQIEPEDTHPTPVMQQRSDVPSQQAFPYVTHTVESESEDDKVIARSHFGNTLIQHVCRSMSDKEAHEAVMNKSWFRKVSDLDAPRLQQRMGSSRPTSMTIPAWASKKLQGEAALWSSRKDNGNGPASSSFSSTPTEEEVQYPLHEMIAPSLEHIEAFLADEKKEKEQASAKSLLTMSRHMPSPDSASSSSNQALCKKDDEEYARLVEERKADEEDFEGYWESRYGDID